jgi:UDP-3-O-[3-hydroxymyristoyl] N-acetylglucosamine deacetylase
MTRRTLAGDVEISGIALHAGVPAKVTLGQAAPDTGIVFRRRDRSGTAPFAALWSNVVETRLGTVIAGKDGASVGVVEHLMSALAGAGIDDCAIEVEGPEPPILDGDALSYLREIENAGIREQNGDRVEIKVLRAVEVASGEASCGFYPSEKPEFRFEIDFAVPAIGHQEYVFEFSLSGYRREIAPARTFGFLRDAEALRAAGLARGADLSNTLVIGEDGVINAELQRFPDEFVRHKILDAIGDMKLAGKPIIGRFEGRRSSHALNVALLKALFANRANYEIVS